MSDKPFLQLSVHQLIDFLLRQGDIDDRVYNQETMQMGTKLHSSYQKKQGNSYLSEYPLSATISLEEGTIALQGRADGIIVGGPFPIIDEIKSTVVPLDDFFNEQKEWHLGQALCYAYMYLNEKGGEEAGVQLTYLSQVNPDETLVKNFHFTKEEIVSTIEGLAKEYLAFWEESRSHAKARDDAAKTLKFPYSSFRGGQREFAKYAYGVASRGGYFFAEAPTGIGKTMSSLYPAVKGFHSGRLDRIFYLTAKNTGGLSAYDALTDLYQAGFPGRDSFLVSKEKMCFNPGHSCNPDDCLFAKGYYSKLKNLLKSVVASNKRFDKLTITEYCRKELVCPFEFQLDLSLFSDVIICDYNYFFDPIVHLERYFGEMADASTSLLLVDETHNLVDRGRMIYSMKISQRQAKEAKDALRGKNAKSLMRSLKKIIDAFEDFKFQCADYLELDDVPEEFLKALESLKRSHQKNEKENPGRMPEEYRSFSRDANRLVRLYNDFFGPTYKVYLERYGDNITLNMYCLDPSKFLAESLTHVKGAVFFSATLSPIEYYLETILGKDDAPYLLLPSPFPKENFHLMVAPKVSTRYKNRERSYPEVAKYLHSYVASKKGNYFIYFPSYEYLENIRPLLNFGDAEVLEQARKMSNEEKEEFLACFEPNPSKTTIGLMILGGAFSEGVDLVSDRLIGVAIVGIGLPQVGFENDLIRDYFDKKKGDGFDYAYKYPGINKVTQAVGRLIRSESDIGSALLIDERYLQSDYRDCFSRTWPGFEIVYSPEEVQKSLKAFYKKKDA